MTLVTRFLKERVASADIALEFDRTYAMSHSNC